MDTQAKNAAKRRFETLHVRLAPEMYRELTAEARAEGLATSTWARRILVLVLAGSRKKKAC